MRKHNGMRPQDVVILLNILLFDQQDWNQATLATHLEISMAEISESLNRSRIAKLIDYDKRNVNRQNLFEFLVHGLKFVFPQQPGALVRGVPTAHAHPDLEQRFPSDMKYVWPDSNGSSLGLTIEPLYPKQARAARKNEALYKAMALIDVLRVGRVREIEFASKELKKMILHESSAKHNAN